MITKTKREWCAMLAKLVAPMEPERAAVAFIDMLPMLPPDDALYTRQTLDRAATCDRKTSVPTFADLSRVLGEAAKERLPANVRMGYVPPKWPQIESAAPTDEDREAACYRAQAVKAELVQRSFAAKGVEEKPEPKYLTPLQLAQVALKNGFAMRADWAQALAEHEAGVSGAVLGG
jgi:hypothetical protein